MSKKAAHSVVLEKIVHFVNETRDPRVNVLHLRIIFQVLAEVLGEIPIPENARKDSATILRHAVANSPEFVQEYITDQLIKDIEG